MSDNGDARSGRGIEEVVERLRNRGEMIISDEMIEGAHPYGHGLLDAADEIEEVLD